jgi:hypothetical protein
MVLEAIVPTHHTYPILEKQSYCLEKLFKLIFFLLIWYIGKPLLYRTKSRAH